MFDADLVEVVCHYHAVGADEAENAAHDLVRAGAIVGVDQDNFMVMVAHLCRLAGVSEADQVFGERPLFFVAGSALADLERLEPLAAQG